MAKSKVDYKQYYQSYLNQLETKAREASGAAVQSAWSGFFATVNDRVDKIFTAAITDFYADYTPKFYNRKNSLYNLMMTDVGADYIKIWFDPDKMSPFRSGYSGEDGLYEQTFRKGWHGGAASGEGHPSPGTPYWRTGVNFSSWGRPAAIAETSPLENIKNGIAEYQNNQMWKDFTSAWNTYCKGIKISF